jgi:hypothetical protein
MTRPILPRTNSCPVLDAVQAERPTAAVSLRRRSVEAAPLAVQPSTAEEQDVLVAAKERLPAWLAQSPQLTLSSGSEGWSGMRCVVVKDGSSTYHLKFQAGMQVPKISKEILQAAYYADSKIAPPALHLDVRRNSLLTQAIKTVAQGSGWWAMAKEPAYLPAILACVVQFHDLHRGASTKPVDTQELRASIEEKAAQARIAAVEDPQEVDRTLNIALGCIQQLQGLQYQPTRCHNDMQQLNILHDGERAWLIDWDSVRDGDPMMELANLCYHLNGAQVDFRSIFAQLPARLQETDPSMLQRLEIYMALHCAERLLKGIIGVPWGTDFVGLREFLSRAEQHAL